MKKIMLSLLFVVGTMAASKEAPKPASHLEKASDEEYYSSDTFRPGDPIYFMVSFSTMTPARQREVRERMAFVKGAAAGALAVALVTAAGAFIVYANKCAGN
jgi:hypothetical protein